MRSFFENSGPAALITGISGQDGAYLSKFLLGRGYRVIGLLRRSASSDSVRERLRWIGVQDEIELVDADMIDLSSLIRVVQRYMPDEIYNLAAQSHLAASWQEPLLTGHVTGLGAANLLEAIRIVHPDARFCQASSSEMFGATQERIQCEATPFQPRSPYACAKLYAHWITVNYRESFGLHASSCILFSHESPLRGLEFVTRKITDGVARIKLGLAKELVLGNLEARGDCGHASDHVRTMWLMLQQDAPDDYVVATGRTTSIHEFCRMAFAHAGLDHERFVRVGEKHKRPADANVRQGNAAKARARLGWSQEVSLEELVAEMVEADLARYRERQC